MQIEKIFNSIKEISKQQEELYKHLHSHPELPMQENDTANLVKEKLISFGYDVIEIGGGVVGVLKNGDGKTVLFRADMDALPVKEMTGLPYASKEVAKNENGEIVPVMHACGHDFHVTAGVGAAQIMAEHKDLWTGTYIALFQPAEEVGSGAKGMIDAGLKDKIPHPDVAFGQHVLTTPVSGQVGVCKGQFLSTAASIDIKVYGKGSHGSMPHMGIDTVVLASSIVMRLQGIVAREINPFDFAVVTVGALNAGTVSNIIPEEAVIRINIRAFSDKIREHLISSIKRITIAECEASNSPKAPEFKIYNLYPATINDEQIAKNLIEIFKKYLGEENVVDDYKPMTASEDFSNIPTALGTPYVYWGLGGFKAESKIVPNHNPAFAPDMHPTLETGVKAAVVATLSYLGKNI